VQRINGPEFSQIFSAQIKETLVAKLHGNNFSTQEAMGLGKGISPEKMNEMLNELKTLADKGLSPEHIRAVFLAGFVRGGPELRPGVRGGGVEGVLYFLKQAGNQNYLEPQNGFEAIKGLLSDNEHKRSFLFIHYQTNLMRGVLSPTLDDIYKKPNVLATWLAEVQEEERRLINQGGNNPYPRTTPINLDAEGIDPRARPAVESTKDFLVGRGCFRRSWLIAKSMNGGRDHNGVGSDKSMQGESLTSLGRAGLKPGDVVYISLRPGSDPASMNMDNIPHWAVVIGLGKNGEPIMSDNWDRAISLTEWNQKYGAAGRRVDEIFRA